MNRETELQLIKRCHELGSAKTTTLAEAEASSDTLRYRCPHHFSLEMEKLHKVHPFPVAHSSEVPENNCVKPAITPLGNLIVSRDKQGHPHLFHNICRHRGAQLLSGESRCSQRITCPYHAWSYATDGKLVSVPGQQHCFPNLDKAKNPLLEIPCVEKYGFIWAIPHALDHPAPHLDRCLEGVAPELAWLQLDQLALFKRHSRVWHANWKLVAEGGMETYHFSYAHRDTIGPYFMNNTAVIHSLGNHQLVVMPTRALEDVMSRPVKDQHIRDCSHILYTLFPTSALLVQHDHVDWIYFRPVSVDSTEVQITSLVPAHRLEPDRNHWQRNHDITVNVLNEDFALGESIQASMSSGALQHIQYGRNEWALKRMNVLVDRILHENVLQEDRLQGNGLQEDGLQERALPEHGLREQAQKA